MINIKLLKNVKISIIIFEDSTTKKLSFDFNNKIFSNFIFLIYILY